MPKPVDHHDDRVDSVLRKADDRLRELCGELRDVVTKELQTATVKLLDKVEPQLGLSLTSPKNETSPASPVFPANLRPSSPGRAFAWTSPPEVIDIPGANHQEYAPRWAERLTPAGGASKVLSELKEEWGMVESEQEPDEVRAFETLTPAASKGLREAAAGPGGHASTYACVH
eukprot:s563_g5.t1